MPSDDCASSLAPVCRSQLPNGTRRNWCSTLNTYPFVAQIVGGFRDTRGTRAEQTWTSTACSSASSPSCHPRHCETIYSPCRTSATGSPRSSASLLTFRMRVTTDSPRRSCPPPFVRGRRICRTRSQTSGARSKARTRQPACMLFATLSSRVRRPSELAGPLRRLPSYVDSFVRACRPVADVCPSSRLPQSSSPSFALRSVFLSFCHSLFRSDAPLDHAETFPRRAQQMGTVPGGCTRESLVLPSGAAIVIHCGLRRPS